MTNRDNKPQGIDFEAMEAAFKRAAWKAVHGTREERSGRFLRATPEDIAAVERAMKQWTAKQDEVAKAPHTTALDTEAAHAAKNAALVKESNKALG